MWQYRRSEPSGCSRTTRAILQCVFSPTKPYTTWQPASSSLCAHAMLARSSNLALISTTTTTCLPASAASMSASTISESPLVRYSVCLIASTRGSAAAETTRRSVLAANESYGWCTRTSRSEIAAKMLLSVGSMVSDGTNGGYLSCGRSRSAIADRPERSSGPGTRYTALVSTPSSVTSRSSTSLDIDSSTSSRTACSNRRRVSSRSIDFSRSSVTSSSISRSRILVTRNTWCSSTSRPANSSGRCAAITSSSGTNRLGATVRNRGSSGGTLTRAKIVAPVSGSAIITARLSERPEIYGNGCAGSTTSGVSTG